MKNFNNKSKKEQFFIMTIICVALFSCFCVTGCGESKSCEKPGYGSHDADGIKVSGCSIPGCGGCLSSGKGCNSACWPQSYKISKISNEKSNDETKIDIIACDTRYYGGGCLGCGQSEKSCYSGCGKWDGENKIKGIFYGSSDSKERVIGCYNGCGGCFGTDGEIGNAVHEMEMLEEIE